MSLEAEERRIIRRTKLRSTILASVQLAGVLSIAAIAPMALAAVGSAHKRWSKYNVRSAVERLRRKGLVTIEQGRVRLTKAGEQYIAVAQLQISVPKRWDGKWRVVIFDISEARKQLRDQLRGALQQIGFIQLQHSVWVFPYDCEELVALLKANYRVGKDVLYMIVDKIENDRVIRSRFDLPAERY